MSPSALAAAAGVGAIVGAVKTLVGFGGQIINVASAFEQTQMALTTVLGDADKGQQMFDKLRKFSFQTTFGVDELASASSQLLNVGVSTHALEKDLKMLGDLAQGDKVKFQELTSIFAKVQSTGKATSMQLQQIALRGIPINQVLAELGVTGTASAEQLTAAFAKLTGEGGKFQNAMENINKTIEGKKGFISDTWKEILVNIGEITGLTKTWKSVLDSVGDTLNDINNALIRRKKIQSGEGLSNEDQINILETKIKKLEDRAKQPNLTAGYLEALQAQIEDYKVQLEILTSAEEQWQKSLKASEDALAQYEEQFNKFEKTQQNIKSKYYQTDEGKRVQQLEELQEYKNMRNSQRRVKKYLKNGMEYEEIEKLDPEYLKMLDAIIAQMEKDIYGTKDAAKDLGKTWKEVFEDVTGFAVKAGETGAQVAQRFIEGMDSDSVEEQFSKMLGLDGDALEQAQKKAEDLQSTILSLMKAKTKAGDEFKWDDKSIQTLINKYKEVNEQIKKEKELLEEKQRLEAIESDIANAKRQEEILREQIRLLDEECASYERLEEAKRRAELVNQKYSVDKVEELMTQESTNKQLENALNMKKQYKESFDNLKKQHALMGKTAKEQIYIEKLEELKTKNLGEQTKELEEQAALYAEQSAELSKQQQLANATYLQNKFSEMVRTSSEAYNEGGRGGGNIGNYTKGKAGLEALNLVQGTDVGNFIEGFQEHGVAGGVINTLIKALGDVVGGIEGLNIILNPIKQLLQAFAPLIKALLYPFLLLAQLLAKLGEVLMKVLNVLTFGLIGKLSDKFDMLVSSSTELSVQQQSEADRLKALNAQYAALKSAIKEQEDYYLKKRRELNADFINQQISAGLSVNDMILTPQGNFSTHPDDYIIATKNPQSLGGGASINVVVNNSIADKASVSVEKRSNAEGFSELVVNISKAVARDYANGTNGWEGAVMARAQQGAGRSFS